MPEKTKQQYDRERYQRIKNDPVLWAKRQAQKKALANSGVDYTVRRDEYYQENREYFRELRRNYQKAHRREDAARQAKRRADKLKATPSWANLDKIKEIYMNCPKGYHVDHIIPLKGKNVSGLHVESNLQYLPAEDNQRKSNKWIF